MGNMIWFIIMIPCSALFTAFGILARKRRKPVRFWAGSALKAEEIADVPAYNRASGWMWILFSAVLWISALSAVRSVKLAGILLIAGMIFSVPAMMFAHGRIYEKYRIRG